MSGNSKTLKEIYKEKYQTKDIVGNPLLGAEAVGYLRGILQFNPSEDWIKDELNFLRLMVIMSLGKGL